MICFDYNLVYVPKNSSYLEFDFGDDTVCKTPPMAFAETNYHVIKQILE